MNNTQFNNTYYTRSWSWKWTPTSIFWSMTDTPRRARIICDKTKDCMYFPKLINTPHLSSVGITQSWRYMVRCRLREQFSLEQILEANLEDDWGKTSILKEICHQELPEYINKRKRSRNATRFELGKVGLRQSYPQDVINNILTFTRFL